MPLFLERNFAVSSLALVCAGAGLASFSLFEALAEEREKPGTLVSLQGLYRKLPDGNALFSSAKISTETRRAVLMLAREPRNEAEFLSASEKFETIKNALPSGNFIFLADDSGEVLLQREIPPTRKIFELADEIKILSARLRSVPVNYFPADCVREKIRTDVYAGNAEFPVPAEKNGGAR